MTTILKLKALMLLFLTSAFIANAGSPFQNAQITLQSPSGKSYKATTDANGKFSINGVDEDCDGFSISVKSGNSVFQTGNNNKLSVPKQTQGVTFGEKTITSPRDAASGQATGKRQHKPIVFKTSLCPKGSEDCDDVDACYVELTIDGSNIQGMAINEKGLPGEKKPKKSNK